MAYIQDYLEKLRKHAEQQSQETKEKTQPRPFKPLTEQITELMQTTTPRLRERPWSMQEIIVRLDGKYRDRPHAQMVGNALKILGWQRVRLWSKGYDGVRLWTPPKYKTR